MATEATGKTQSANRGSGGDTPAAQLADLLNGSTYGTRAVGLVLGVEDPAHVEGKNAKGRPYSFFTRRTQLFDGASTLVLAETADKLEDLPPAVAPATVQTFRVERARMDGRQMVMNGHFETQAKG